jgi:hypothetical protein
MSENPVGKFIDLIEPCVNAATAEGVSEQECRAAMFKTVPKLEQNEMFAKFLPLLYARKTAAAENGIKLKSASRFAESLEQLRSACKGRAIPRHFPAKSTILAYFEHTLSQLSELEIVAVFAQRFSDEEDCGTTAHHKCNCHSE